MAKMGGRQQSTSRIQEETQFISLMLTAVESRFFKPRKGTKIGSGNIGEYEELGIKLQYCFLVYSET